MIQYDNLEISTIRSGKGDCIHIRFPDENNQYLNIIIDTGPTAISGAFRSLVNQIQGRGEVIDSLIITHYDDDHIGGALRCENLPIRSTYFNAYNAEKDNGLLSARQSQRLFHMLPATVVHTDIVAGTNVKVGSTEHTEIKDLISKKTPDGYKWDIIKNEFIITPYGRKFIDMCM